VQQLAYKGSSIVVTDQTFCGQYAPKSHISYNGAYVAFLAGKPGAAAILTPLLTFSNFKESLT
jgi:hypothetical protein